MTSDVVPFGKYRGQPVEVLAADRGYCDWLAAQPWFRERYASLHTVIINNFLPAPTDTPEHNALQARFLDPAFCRAFADNTGLAAHITRKVSEHLQERVERAVEAHESARAELDKYLVVGNASDWLLKHKEASLASCLRELDEQRTAAATAPQITCKVEAFEEHGWDVALFAHDRKERDEYGSFSRQVWLELKPTLGDDFPSVLRQMKTNANHPGVRAKRGAVINEFVCLVGSFNASGASFDQVRQMFNAGGHMVFLISEIEPA